MASPAAASALVTGLPADAKLGDVESLVKPLCTGRLVSIDLPGNGTALVEFSLLPAP